MRALFLLPLLILATACQKEVPPPGSTYGTVSAAPAAIPDFQAVSHLGEPRSKADLLGHPTVVWFFPAAGTPG